jgi:hypothetical protein
VNLSREWELLLACARGKLSAEERSRITDLVDADLDWNRIVAISYAHGIAPLIYHNLLASGVVTRLPPRPAKRLKGSYYGNAARNTVLYNELKKVLSALQSRGIDVIVLKGAALAQTVYPSIALRPMADIDLLGRKEKVTDVEQKMLDMGYTLHVSVSEHLQKNRYHAAFRSKSGTTIEIHWHIKRLTGPFSIDLERLWERSRPIKIAGVDALVLSPEDLLLHLCQHHWKHNLTVGIRPLCDLAEAIKYYGDKIDWGQVANTSSEWQMNTCSYLQLQLAKELLDAPIPEPFLKELKPANFDPAIMSWVKERLLCERKNVSVFSDLLQLLGKGQPLEARMLVVRRLLSPKTVAMTYGYPSVPKMIWQCYPLHMKHLLGRYVPPAWGLIVGDQKTRAAAEREERLTNWLSSGYR